MQDDTLFGLETDAARAGGGGGSTTPCSATRSRTRLSPRIHARFADQIGIALRYDAIDADASSASPPRSPRFARARRPRRQRHAAAEGGRGHAVHATRAGAHARRRGQHADASRGDGWHGDNTDGAGWCATSPSATGSTCADAARCCSAPAARRTASRRRCSTPASPNCSSSTAPRSAPTRSPIASASRRACTSRYWEDLGSRGRVRPDRQRDLRRARRRRLRPARLAARHAHPRATTSTTATPRFRSWPGRAAAAPRRRSTASACWSSRRRRRSSSGTGGDPTPIRCTRRSAPARPRCTPRTDAGADARSCRCLPHRLRRLLHRAVDLVADPRHAARQARRHALRAVAWPTIAARSSGAPERPAVCVALRPQRVDVRATPSRVER